MWEEGSTVNAAGVPRRLLAPITLKEDRSRPFVAKLFSADRPARYAVELLGPELRMEVENLEAQAFGPLIAEIGKSLITHGAAGQTSHVPFQHEPSLEIAESLEIWDRVIVEETSDHFFDDVVRIADLAFSGYKSLGTLGEKLAALRWACSTRWLAGRALACKPRALGTNCRSPDPVTSHKEAFQAKAAIIKMLKELAVDPSILAMFDYDLVGYGVWHSGGREPLPEEATNEWWRRFAEMDLMALWRQVQRLPPPELDASIPVLTLLQLYPEPNWELPLPLAARAIMEKHGWLVEVRQPAINGHLPDKALIQGPLLLADAPELWQPDLADPSVFESIQRGEDQGKGHQSEGLPGALHGSVGMIMAAMCAQESLRNIRIYPGLLKIQGFAEVFLRYSPSICSLEFRHCHELINLALLHQLSLVGENLQILDLEDCGLDGSHMEALAKALRFMPGVRQLDLSGNEIDGQAGIRFIRMLAESRVDVAQLRMDRNPIGDKRGFTEEVATILATRGERVVAGGEIVFDLTGESMRWAAQPGTTGMTIPIKALHKHAVQRKVFVESIAAEKSQYSAGSDWLAKHRKHHDVLVNHPIMKIWQKEVQLAGGADVADLHLAEEASRDESAPSRRDSRSKSGSKSSHHSHTRSRQSSVTGSKAASTMNRIHSKASRH
mmetsp:Transcript_64857/g.154857  ORF Transcript_64857/g.154857 Transcript_64857/m.154857 type:complete len:667 (+) Transcript_64857:60-2060(+)